jgi:hypothetical protein
MLEFRIIFKKTNAFFEQNIQYDHELLSVFKFENLGQLNFLLIVEENNSNFQL